MPQSNVHATITGCVDDVLLGCPLQASFDGIDAFDAYTEAETETSLVVSVDGGKVTATYGNLAQFVVLKDPENVASVLENGFAHHQVLALADKVIDADTSKSIINIYNKYNVYLHVYKQNIHIASDIDFYLKRYIEKEKVNDVGIGLENIEDFEFNKMVFIGDREELERLQNDIRNNFNVHTCFSHTNFLEVLASGINKGSALEWICNQKGIKRDEVVAFGDNYNDIEMIEYAGIGVAMENAEEALKKKADYICLTNDDDGVGKFLKKYMKF